MQFSNEGLTTDGGGDADCLTRPNQNALALIHLLYSPFAFIHPAIACPMAGPESS
jgi:hypothetical protein